MNMPISTDSQDRTLPPAYKGPRGAMLLELKRAGSLTARELADKLNLSLNAVRHHLKELESEAVVGYRREQRGVGAPTFAYILSPAGEALFPQGYKDVLTELMDRVAAQAGREAVVRALETRYVELSQRLQAGLADASPARRMEVVMRALVEGGFLAEWRQDEGSLRLREHHCAIRAVAERFPEVCAAEARFLAEVLAAAVERDQHILQGCTACEYQIRFTNDATAPTARGGWKDEASGEQA